MKLLLHRDIFRPNVTLGTLAIVFDGALAYDGTWRTGAPRGPLEFGFVAEDVDRGLVAEDPAGCAKLKVKGKTAIPVGDYVVSRTWSPKYQRDMMLVHDVPAFSGIRIHPGRDENDSEGCLLPGTKRDTQAGRIVPGRSRPAWEWLDARVKECDERGEEVRIVIDRAAGAWADFQRGGGAR